MTPMPDVRIEYRCLASIESVSLLERLAAESWTTLQLAGTAKVAGPGIWQVDGVVVGSEHPILLRSAVIDVAAKLEAFLISASSFQSPGRSASMSTRIQDFPLKDAFTGVNQLSIAARRLSSPSWEDLPVSTLLVEDVLIVRGRGETLFIAADDDIPGMLRIATQWPNLPMAESEIAYIRRL